MKVIENNAVLAVVTYNKDAAKEVKDKDKANEVTITVATLLNANSSFELPYFLINGESDLRYQLLESFYRLVDIVGKDCITPEQLHSIGSYSITNGESTEIVSVFLAFVDGKPSIQCKDGDKTAVWMSIDAFEHLPLYGNHNVIINDIRKHLLEMAMTPSGGLSLGEETKRAIISKYCPKPKDNETKHPWHPWIKRLQGCGFNIYDNLHPGVAIDVVIFGYKKAEKGRHDELSVLLTYRKEDPNIDEGDIDEWAGTWSLPGTFLKEKMVEVPKDEGEDSPDIIKDKEGHRMFRCVETIREAVKRVACQKTGIEIKDDEELYYLRPLVHYSRMKWRHRDGSTVITLPVFIPIEYTEVNGKLSSLTTSECKWFPIKRKLWTINKEDGEGIKKEVIRGGDCPMKQNDDGLYVNITDDSVDENSTIETWKLKDWEDNNLRSPEEVGLPAADVYIQDNQLIIDYYKEVSRPYKPIQDKNYIRGFKPEGKELLTADHANIIISALQEISSNTKRTLHIVSKLLDGGIFAPAEIKRMLETWFFPWIFSRSNMQKKLRDTNKFIKEVSDKTSGSKNRSWSYVFADVDTIDKELLKNKPI